MGSANSTSDERIGAAAPPDTATGSVPAIEGARPWIFAAGLLALWLIRNDYRGLEHDAQIYALQALARLRPDLFAGDVYLAFGSQDRFTIFTPLYASLIEQFGLPHAAALLTALCQLGFAVSAWLLARRLAGPPVAWLSLGFAVAIPGSYGAADIFTYAEQFLSARNPAEVIGIASLAAWLADRRLLSACLLLVAASLHPLMATPIGLLVALFAWSDRRLGWPIALGVAGLVLLVSIASFMPVGPVSPLAPEWHEVIRQRSWFVFPHLWSWSDWNASLLPLASLAFAARVLPEGVSRSLATRALIVGTGGLMVALVGASLFPVELVVQGQAWRWIWIARLVAVLLLPVLVATAWRTDRTRLPAVALLLTAWMAEPVAGSSLALVALLLALLPDAIASRHTRLLRIAAIVSFTVAGAWICGNALTALKNEFVFGAGPVFLERLQDVLAPAALAMLVTLGLWVAVARRRSFLPALAAGAVALVFVALRLPVYTQQLADDSSFERAYAGFAEWRRAIPPRAEVLWFESPGAVWFFLNRPSFISRSQSAGVVFSSETARNVLERTHAVNALVDRDWMIRIADHTPARPLLRPLTPERLASVCQHPQLAFVVSRDRLALPSLPSRAPGVWASFRLYDCATVRSAAS